MFSGLFSNVLVVVLHSLAGTHGVQPPPRRLHGLHHAGVEGGVRGE